MFITILHKLYKHGKKKLLLLSMARDISMSYKKIPKHLKLKQF